MAKPIHSMIRVLEEDRAVTFYRAAMGLEIVDRYPFDSFTLIYMRDPASTFELELTVNQGRTEPYNLGDGYGHLAVAVDDLRGHLRRGDRRPRDRERALRAVPRDREHHVGPLRPPDRRRTPARPGRR